MDKYSLMDTLRIINTARPDLFPLDADEINAIERKAADDPGLLTDNELFLLTVAKVEYYMWEVYNEDDPENGDRRFNHGLGRI
jgi:hypothetical protein